MYRFMQMIYSVLNHLSIVGPDQGMCGCDQRCICQPDWTGTACDCTLLTTPCVSPFGVSTVIVSVRG